ncbi:MAG: hypothetical protein KGI58_02165 [Patescibacteria group bacterium]|nr:hypothetical protein [Patescibacteria group bacterium]
MKLMRVSNPVQKSKSQLAISASKNVQTVVTLLRQAGASKSIIEQAKKSCNTKNNFAFISQSNNASAVV